MISWGKYLFNTYSRQPIMLVRGRGMYVWDSNGNRYLDFTSGIGVNALGHCDPNVVNAIKKKASELLHCSNLYYVEEQCVLAEQICRLTKLDKVFFCNSGTEAVEGALKLSYKHSRRKVVIAATGSFHGRTAGSLSVTHEMRFREPFMPILPGNTRFVEYNNLESLRSAMSRDVGCVILEPIQGESGVRVPSRDYLKGVREICDEFECLLVLDEVQTGFGRTGKWFCKDHYGVQPDLMTLAKAIGGGLPLGAIVAKEEVSNAFEVGDHASTFGGNPVSCAAALAVLRELRRRRLVQRARMMGEYMMRRLKEIDSPKISEVRGKGLMIGMELNEECSWVVDEMRRRGFLINCTAGKVLRFLPPLIVQRSHIDRMVEELGRVI